MNESETWNCEQAHTGHFGKVSQQHCKVSEQGPLSGVLLSVTMHVVRTQFPIWKARGLAGTKGSAVKIDRNFKLW